MSNRIGVLFVCMGNICRSPLAKIVFESQAKHAGILDRVEIDSGGTLNWHAGEGADPRSVVIAQLRGLGLQHIARQVNRSDFERFHHLIVMDRRNLEDMIQLGAPRSKIRLMREFDPNLVGRTTDELAVPDPYQGTQRHFEQVFDMLVPAAAGLAEHIRRELRG
jgi:protein-tyrosine phosphatase